MSRYPRNNPKIDNQATKGLLGTHNSLAYRVHEIETHFHSVERWFGISADQSGTDWALEDTLNPYVAISGDGIFSAVASDYAKLIGLGDASAIGDGVYYDLHRIFITNLSVDTPYLIRVVWLSGAQTIANALTAEQYTTIMVNNNPAGSKAGGVPIPIQMPRLQWGVHAVSAMIKCATDNATASFFIGLHEYEG